MKFSIIIPVYNVEAYLEKCLDSILSSKYSAEDYEILLINDGSTDLSEKICESYSQQYSQIRYFSFQNQGVAKTRNFGINNSEGEFIIFIDSDDFVTEEMFEIASASILDVPDVVLLSYFATKPNYRDFIERNIAQDGLMDAKSVYGEFIRLYSGGFIYFSHTKIYNRKFLLENDLLFPTLTVSEDTVFNFKVLEKAKTFFFQSRPYYCYVTDRPNSVMSEYTPKRIEGQLFEWELLKDLLLKIDKYDAKFVDNRLAKIFYGCSDSIVKSSQNLTWKKEQLEQLLNHSKLKDFFDTNSAATSNKLSYFLLKNKLLLSYIFLKSIMRRIKNTRMR
ncbi:glycosyltransferase [Streptococcus suis]|uniref:glycosyltransferase family 2 protein n=1 Tax=Streptococcus sp. A18 TaxID=3373125 RepID=UPI00211CAF20|nr:glycosyltransferase [Streptococcus suis]